MFSSRFWAVTVILLVGRVPEAALQVPAVGRPEVDRSEARPRGRVLGLERIALDRVSGSERRVAEGVRLEALVEVVEAEEPVPAALRVAREAKLLGELVELGQPVGALRGEGDEAGAGGGREDRAVAAVDVAAAVHLVERLVPGHRGQRRAAEVVVELEHPAVRPDLLLVEAVLGDLVLLEAGDQLVGTGLQDVGAEDARGAVEVPAVDVEEGLELLRGLPEELQPSGPGRLATERVALAGEGVVDPVGLRLVEQRGARRQGLGEAAPHRRLEVDVVVGAVGHPGEPVQLLRRPDRLELDDTGRRVAPEDGALRATEHLRALQVEERHALDHRVLEHHVVDHHRDRLGGVEVEVRVAEAADVEAREGAAEGGLEQEARHPGREGLDVGATGGQEGELVGVEGGHRERDLLDVLLALLGGDRDLLEDLGRRRGGGLGLGLLGLLLGGRLAQDHAGRGEQGAGGEHGNPSRASRCESGHFVPPCELGRTGSVAPEASAGGRLDTRGALTAP